VNKIIAGNYDADADELEKLLADVQRTIRENDQFVRRLKEEATVVDDDTEEESVGDVGTDSIIFEEL
jgi:hypothetical protein